MYDDFVPLERLITPGRILCWGAKWIGEKTYYSADEREGAQVMLLKLHALLLEADAVVTYNGDRFDLPRVNGAMILEGLDPLPPVASIDMLKAVKKFGQQSNKLAYIGPMFGCGNKVDTGGFSLWRKIVETNDPVAWGKMIRYNRRDVYLLARLYLRLRPFIRNHPHLGGKKACSACGSLATQHRGDRKTRAFKIARIWCKRCGHWTDGKRTKR